MRVGAHVHRRWVMVVLGSFLGMAVVAACIFGIDALRFPVCPRCGTNGHVLRIPAGPICLVHGMLRR
ncbi:hypothetical protein HY480_03035 [Candidatus Uhrbacteria bacterium]|nr:hypothetical protein [Candidatus Uhrbacteria bacterium]